MKKAVDVTIHLSDDAIAWVAEKFSCSENEAHEKLERLVQVECTDRMNWLTPVLEGDNLMLIHVDESASEGYDRYDGSVSE